jgi:hypothetical protein
VCESRKNTSPYPFGSNHEFMMYKNTMARMRSIGIDDVLTCVIVTCAAGVSPGNWNNALQAQI